MNYNNLPAKALIYLDSPILKKFIKNPKNWYTFSNDLANKLGNEYEISPLWSYYLLFEFLGITKKTLGISDTNFFIDETTFKKIHNKNQAEKQTTEIGKTIDEHFTYMWITIKQKLLDQTNQQLLINSIEQKIISYKTTASSLDDIAELLDILFGHIIGDIKKDYNKFCHQAALFLAWDCFCNITWTNFPTELLREAQLDIWAKMLEKEFLLPFGKIIDDFAKTNNVTLSDNSHFKGSRGDMVDAEAITYAMIGFTNGKQQSESVLIITEDPLINIQERIQLGQAIITKYLSTIKRSSGAFYRYKNIETLELDTVILCDQK